MGNEHNLAGFGTPIESEGFKAPNLLGDELQGASSVRRWLGEMGELKSNFGNLEITSKTKD